MLSAVPMAHMTDLLLSLHHSSATADGLCQRRTGGPDVTNEQDANMD